MTDKSIETVLYATKTSKVICSIKLSQRANKEPCVTINSSFAELLSQLYNIDFQSTAHDIFLHNIENGSYIDFINSIALCMLKFKIPCKCIVAASLENSFLVYCPEDQTVVYSFIKSTKELDSLVESCIFKYQELLSYDFSEV